MKRKRLDIRCLELGIFESRQKALRAIMAGEVMVNGVVVNEASFWVKDDDRIELKSKMPYISRGGVKLKAAIDHFKIDLKDKICLDVGVATGGFSDCMLKEGALKVYGIDVGKGQVHESLLKNERFFFFPNTNARYLSPEIFGLFFDFVAVDVSFISLKLIINPVLSVMKEGGKAIFLVKPQFELSRKEVKKGIVRDESLRMKAIEGVVDFIKSTNKTQIYGYIDSPIKGAHGNREFLLYLGKI